MKCNVCEKELNNPNDPSSVGQAQCLECRADLGDGLARELMYPILVKRSQVLRVEVKIPETPMFRHSEGGLYTRISEPLGAGASKEEGRIIVYRGMDGRDWWRRPTDFDNRFRRMHERRGNQRNGTGGGD